MLGRTAILVLALIVAGCATSPPPETVEAGMPVLDLAGTWTGTWAGTPVSLSLGRDTEASFPSGLYVGSWLVLGQARPSFSGIITFSRRGEPVSTRAQAWVTSSNGALNLLVQAAPTDGDQELRLRSVDGQRLAGTGRSSFPRGPQGAVELHRGAR